MQRGPRTVRSRLCNKHRTIRVDHVVCIEPLARGAQLVPGGNYRYARLTHHVNHWLPCRRDERDVEGTEPLAGLDQHLIERNVLAGWPHVPTGHDRLLHERARIFDRHLLAHDNGIEAVGHRRSRVDWRELGRSNAGGRTLRVERAHCDSIHRSNPQWWRWSNCADWLRRDTPNCVADRDALGDQRRNEACLSQRSVPTLPGLAWIWIVAHESTAIRFVCE